MDKTDVIMALIQRDYYYIFSIKGDGSAPFSVSLKRGL